jgi:hypothetical protein
MDGLVSGHYLIYKPAQLWYIGLMDRKRPIPHLENLNPSGEWLLLAICVAAVCKTVTLEPSGVQFPPLSWPLCAGADNPECRWPIDPIVKRLSRHPVTVVSRVQISLGSSAFSNPNAY